MRGLIWPLKTVAIAALAGAGLLIASEVEPSGPANAPVGLEAAESGVQQAVDPYRSGGGSLGAGD